MVLLIILRPLQGLRHMTYQHIILIYYVGSKYILLYEGYANVNDDLYSTYM